jgi:hypothetical protein
MQERRNEGGDHHHQLHEDDARVKEMAAEA